MMILYVMYCKDAIHLLDIPYIAYTSHLLYILSAPKKEIKIFDQFY